MNAARLPVQSEYDRGFRDGQAALKRKLAAVLDELAARCRPALVAANDDRASASAPRQSEAPAARPAKASGLGQLKERVLALLTGPEVSLTAKEIMAATGAPYTEVSRACTALSMGGKAVWAYARRPGFRAIKALRLPGAVQPGDGLSENQAKLLDAMKAIAAAQCAVDGEFTASLSGLVEKSGVPRGSVVSVIDALAAKGRVRMLESGRGRRLSRFRLAPPPLAKPVDGYKPAPALPVPAPVVPIRTKIARPAPAPTADDLPPPSKVAAPRSLNARKPGQCAYPVNSPPAGRGEETEYCCAPVSGKLQYCEAHARAMFAPRKVKP